MHTIDTRGLSCPQPVLLVLQCLKGKDGQQPPPVLTVLVDNDASLENVTRAAQNNGYAVTGTPAPEHGTTVTQLTLSKA